jgi:serine/threonine protein phosphatase PrpC
MWFLSRNNKKIENLIYAAYTHPGSRPGGNQDSLYARRRSDFAVFCVADGMGGHSKGELASAKITECMKNWCESLPEPYEGSKEELFDDFEKVIENANRIVYSEYNKTAVCGSTVVALLIFRGKYCIVSVGDSRCYRRNGANMVQITKDDVWQGIENDPSFDANKGKLLKAVGVSEDLIANRQTGNISKNDMFLLCSDGIYKVLGDDYISNLAGELRGCLSDEDMMAVLGRIHQDVDKCGAPDNNTGILVRR